MINSTFSKSKKVVCTAETPLLTTLLDRHRTRMWMKRSSLPNSPILRWNAD